MSTCWQGRAKKAPAYPQHRVGNLDEVRNEPCRKVCGRDSRQAAAAGVDRIRAQDEERHRAANLPHRVERRQRQRSRAQRGRRRYIPTGEGQRRP
jgi:hypothetical protein